MTSSNPKTHAPTDELPTVSAAAPPPNKLPAQATYITTHDPATKRSVFHDSKAAEWTQPFDEHMFFKHLFTQTKARPSFADDADVAAHEAIVASGSTGLVGEGTLIRVVDFAPGYECIMHRTQSLDFGILVEGSLVACLDSGEERALNRGDVVVQRGTMHSWRNTGTEWARIVFVLTASEEIKVGGEVLPEGFIAPDEVKAIRQAAKEEESKKAVKPSL